MGKLGNAKYSAKLDLANGFWWVPVGKALQKYLTFVCRKGTIRFLCMPFAPKYAPVAFKALVNRVLHNTLFIKHFAYIDDIIVFGKTEEYVVERVVDVTNRL